LKNADLTATDISATEEGTSFTVVLGRAEQTRTIKAFIPVQGLHMVQNALMAIAAALELGVALESAVKGLSRAELAGGRLENARTEESHFSTTPTTRIRIRWKPL
jgi:UDP-N-acetylmuramoyl-tripeptide--D-alanyl-D-alanine ligase